jgi:hypothetical protein
MPQMRLGRMLAIATLVTGLVGLVGVPDAGAAVPEAKEKIQATVKRLKKALKSGKCQALGNVLRHSSGRANPDDPSKPVKPSTKFTAEECTSLDEFATALDGFTPKKSKEYGTAALVEGTKGEDNVIITFALDVDGKWRAISSGPLATQIGTTSTLDYNGSLTSWLDAVKNGNCQEVWLRFTVDSPYVTSRASSGGVTKWCTDFQGAVDRGSGRIYDLVAATDPPQQFAKLQDIGIFGIELISGRYITILMLSEPGAEAEHANPGVFEFVTTRQPKKK